MLCPPGCYLKNNKLLPLRKVPGTRSLEQKKKIMQSALIFLDLLRVGCDCEWRGKLSIEL